MRKLLHTISVIVLLSFVTIQTADACFCCCHIFHKISHAVKHVAKKVAHTVTHPKAIVKAVKKVTKKVIKKAVKVVKKTVHVVTHPVQDIKTVVKTAKRVAHDVAHPKDALKDVTKIEEKAVHAAAKVANSTLKSGLVKGVAGSVGLGGVVKAVNKGVTMADGMNEMAGSKLGVKANYIPAGMRVPGHESHRQALVKNSPDVLAKYAQQKADAKATIKQLMTLDEASAIATINQNILNAKVIDKIDGATMVAIMIIVARENEDEYGKFLEWLSHDDLQHNNMTPVLLAMTKIAPDLGVAATYALKETELADKLTNQVQALKRAKVEQLPVVTPEVVQVVTQAAATPSAANANRVPAVTEKPHSLIGGESVQEQPHSLIGDVDVTYDQPHSLITGYDAGGNPYGNDEYGGADGMDSSVYYEGGAPDGSYQNEPYPNEQYPSEQYQNPMEGGQFAQGRGYSYG